MQVIILKHGVQNVLNRSVTVALTVCGRDLHLSLSPGVSRCFQSVSRCLQVFPVCLQVSPGVSSLSPGVSSLFPVCLQVSPGVGGLV